MNIASNEGEKIENGYLGELDFKLSSYINSKNKPRTATNRRGFVFLHLDEGKGEYEQV